MKIINKENIIIYIILSLMVIYVIHKKIRVATFNFNNKKLKKHYIELVEEFSIPSYIVNRKNGNIVWEYSTLSKVKNKKCPFKKIILKDEETDYFIYYVIDLHLDSIVCNDNNISYDTFCKELTIRGSNTNEIYSSLLIFLKEVLNENLTDKKEKIYNKIIADNSYKSMIETEICNCIFRINT